VKIVQLEKNEHMTESDPGLQQCTGTFSVFSVTEWFLYFPPTASNPSVFNAGSI